MRNIHWIKIKRRKKFKRRKNGAHFFLTFTIQRKSLNIGLNMSFSVGAHEIGNCPNRSIAQMGNNSHEPEWMKIVKKTSASMMKRFFSRSIHSAQNEWKSKIPTRYQWNQYAKFKWTPYTKIFWYLNFDRSSSLMYRL